MALKYKLETLDGVDEAVKGMYTKQGDVYVLAIDGLPKSEDTSGLKAKVDELLAEKKTEKEKREKAEVDAQKSAEEKARKDGDIEALEKSWSAKYSARETELAGQIDAMKGSVNSMTVDSVASRLASELALPGSAEVMEDHFRKRLSSELRDGQYVTVVKDKDGRPSALTIDDLKTEFTNNAAFAPVLVGSKASGGDAHSHKAGGGGAKESDYFDKKSPNYSKTKQTEIYRDDPARYDQLKSASGQ
jgi:hypothetical protein